LLRFVNCVIKEMMMIMMMIKRKQEAGQNPENISVVGSRGIYRIGTLAMS